SSALDQTGNIREYEATLRADTNHAEMRVESREWVAGDLRPRVRDRPDQRRLPGIRQPEQSCIRENAQLQAQIPLLTRFATGKLARRPVGARLEREFAHPAPASGRDQRAGAIVLEIRNFLAGLFVEDQRSHRDSELDVRARRPVAIRTSARLTVLGLVP